MKSIQDRQFKTAVILILAGLTMMTSLVVFLNVRGSARASAAVRDSRILAIRYLTHLGRSLWNIAAEKDLMVAAQETAGLILQSEAYEKMSKGSQAGLYRLTHERLSRLKELLVEKGRITKPPYYNPQTDTFDAVQYFLDKVFVPAAELLESQEQKKKESVFWDGKVDAYSTGLAVAAVAIFLLTLSLVLSGKSRLAMAGVGLALAAAVAGSSLAAALRPWHEVSSVSLKDLALASGEVLGAKLVLDFGGDLQAASPFTGPAERIIAGILKKDPGYPAAFELRARLRAAVGESLFFAGRLAEGRAEMDRAIADLDTVRRAGQNDGYLDWTRGFVHLLLGRWPEAEASIERALVELPEQGFALGVMKAAVLLYEGKKPASESALEAALAQAARRPLASDPNYFRIFVRNLERFREISPAEGLERMELRLKEASVLIALGKGTRRPAVAATAAPLLFVNPVTDRRGEIIDIPACQEFPASTGRAYFLLQLKGMSRGLAVVRRVYRRLPGQVFWIEQLRLGRTEHWDGPAEARLLGSVEYPMPEAGESLASGRYRLEIFIEGDLKAAGEFKVR
ncbi:MAG: hypothetical protein WCB96_02125 [Candidatus Aminicenantales bacterium]